MLNNRFKNTINSSLMFKSMTSNNTEYFFIFVLSFFIKFIINSIYM